VARREKAGVSFSPSNQLEKSKIPGSLISGKIFDDAMRQLEQILRNHPSGKSIPSIFEGVKQGRDIPFLSSFAVYLQEQSRIGKNVRKTFCRL